MVNSKKGKLLVSLWFKDWKEYNKFKDAVHNGDTDKIMEILKRMEKEKDL